ncbi:hypothetical protein OBV_37280 [Oscillibacter valericigenes Sjm18-20]|nr:hypothetical protein OBV_37280 [Oscillibacter valericigenes Sjm18-20]
MRVGKNSNNAGSAANFFVQPLQHVGGGDFEGVEFQKHIKCQRILRPFLPNLIAFESRFSYRSESCFAR